MKSKKLSVRIVAIIFLLLVSSPVSAQDAAKPSAEPSPAVEAPKDAVQPAAVQEQPAVPKEDTQAVPQATGKAEEAKPKEDVKHAPAYTGRNYLDNRYLAVNLGIGATASPGLFSLKFEAGYIFDGVFSVGPYFQGGIGNSTKFFMMLLDGKFRATIPQTIDELKLTGLIGLGFLYNRTFGLDSWNWTGHAGLGCEYFIMENLSVGPEVIANITSSSAERWFINFFAGANYYF